MRKTLFVQKQFDDLNYCEYMPKIKKGERVPLVLFLHGGGERGNDNKSQLKNAILKVIHSKSKSKFMKSIVLAPQCPTDTRWVNTLSKYGNYKLSEVKESKIIKKVVKLVEMYRNFEYIDKNRVYVIGLSIGGFGSWDLIARHPNIFKAAAPICGGGPIDAIEVLKGIPIYTFHGIDDPVVPCSGTREMVDLITKAGGKDVHFACFNGLGHCIWDDAITFLGDETNPNFENWLFDQ